MTARKSSRENITVKVIESFSKTDNPMNSTGEVIAWLDALNRKIPVSIRNIPYSLDGSWYYDRAELGLVNRKKRLFSIKGVKYKDAEGIHQKPMILPYHIGFAGLLCKIMDGTLYFLVQAKCVPGSTRLFQLAPTVQTMEPDDDTETVPYDSYFKNAEKGTILADRIQSEQGDCFLNKKTRSMILLVQDDIEVSSSFKWLTLGQIHELLCRNLIINEELCAVLSCLPLSSFSLTGNDYRKIKPLFSSEALYQSIFHGSPDQLARPLSTVMNRIRMASAPASVTDLNALEGWSMKNGIYSSDQSRFQIDYYEIDIAGKSFWQQPMFKFNGRSVYGLMYRINEKNKIEFIVHVQQVSGYSDQVEISPSVQKEPHEKRLKNEVEKVFYQHVHSGEGVLHSSLFSQSGDILRNNENWHVLVRTNIEELPVLPTGYFYADSETLQQLIQWSDCLDIHLKCLLLMSMSFKKASCNM